MTRLIVEDVGYDDVELITEDDAGMLDLDIGAFIAGMENARPDGYLVQDGKRACELQLVVAFEDIICPNCGHVQQARILPGVTGWPVFVHECVSCEYVITESEWVSTEEAEDA